VTAATTTTTTTAFVFDQDALDAGTVDQALRHGGGFLVRLAPASELPGQMMAAARSFFALPREKKAALAIEHSAHFRGWSEMQSDRDWREQLHLGLERPPATVAGPAFGRLDGPNLWPADASWRQVVSRYMDAAASLGAQILGRIACALDVAPSRFANVATDGYLVTKLISYHPQPSRQGARPGVAAHVDFSWLTINLQDSPGLEVKRPDGTWAAVAVRPGAVWVHPGELLEHATRGRYQATPHRVLNRSRERARVSIPVFVNPPLDSMVPVLAAESPPAATLAGAGADAGPAGGAAGNEHVHRVLRTPSQGPAFHFGRAEWRRKGQNGWCFACAGHDGEGRRTGGGTRGGPASGAALDDGRGPSHRRREDD
jgi:isopenicillin N synthase-like dioxygenase